MVVGVKVVSSACEVEFFFEVGVDLSSSELSSGVKAEAMKNGSVRSDGSRC